MIEIMRSENFDPNAKELTIIPGLFDKKTGKCLRNTGTIVNAAEEFLDMDEMDR